MKRTPMKRTKPMPRGKPMRRNESRTLPERKRAEGPTTQREPKPRAPISPYSGLRITGVWLDGVKVFPKPRASYTLVAYTPPGDMVVFRGAIPKEGAVQSSAYEKSVKALGYCMRCGRSCEKGVLQFCHADFGKGQSIKTDARRGWPGCPQCHEIVGRVLMRPVRRAVEYLLALMTRAAVNEAGTWPATLPQWNER
jgi:hypothetical protein